MQSLRDGKYRRRRVMSLKTWGVRRGLPSDWGHRLGSPIRRGILRLITTPPVASAPQVEQDLTDKLASTRHCRRWGYSCKAAV